MNKTPRTVGAPRRRGRPSADCARGADELLRVARRTFALRGYEATSVREIARQAEVDPALIAHHFGSKEALWLAVVEQIRELLEPMLETTAALRADASLGPRQRVEHCLLAFIDRVFEHPDIGIFFSTAATEEGERLNVLVDVMVRPFHAVCLPLFSDAMDAGELRRCDPALLFSVLMQGISKTVAYAHVLRAVSPLPDDPGRFKRELTDVALHLLR
ncbi:TetR/AcrR family transcriptional regulator [Mitsuaria sp. TWR114]|jgi:AcrR family transcriptional regulator|uniref:TetR/AcrR family transcriptional regulator n=1 Tax=unclassified Roseateles TaxID=2626991 RepID=UPI0011BE5317|nr:MULTISPECIES: TetR/AcrR family transcriptional regulator [unclassified Roseateles]MBB3291778.1 AcrR family transcriptional regulator [Mitsuaria sp. BK041]MBB3360995.1 AcrR family transcriptional regulator [Mitsuaria sp. BK045]TXD86398.1 TetR/AcrR family transcriptional regulator [Mitsuaria sp. TWR114]